MFLNKYVLWSCGISYCYFEKKKLLFIKFGVMNEWKCIPHDDKQKEYNMIQHTAYNNQFTLHIINTFNKRKTRNWLQIENPLQVDFMHIFWQQDLTFQKKKNDQGIIYKNSQHNK